jgi:hypothetical protein
MIHVILDGALDRLNLRFQAQGVPFVLGYKAQTSS